MRLAVAELDRVCRDAFTWREVLAGGAPWLSWELCATSAARAKLSEWCRRTPRPWVTPDPAAVCTALHFYGDPVLHHVLARLLCELPPPVRDYALSHLTFLGVGLHTLGWTGAPIDVDVRPFLVVLSAAAGTRDSVRALIAHELAHAWLMEEPAPDQVAGTALWQQAVHHTDLADVPADVRADVVRRRTKYDEHERRADALARSWGFPTT